jgi:hypothetical protein
MVRRIRRHLASNVVAYIALFLALGGTAVAATKLPKNSVGTKQLKNNAVISSKVKDGSLMFADLMAGQVQRPVRWALVLADGTIKAQSGGISMDHAAAGSFYLNFGANMSGHAISVTDAFRDDDVNPRGAPLTTICGGPPNSTCVFAGTNTTHFIWVGTFAQDNHTYQDHAFYIEVF